MSILSAPSETASEIAKALNLPESTFAFTLSVCVGEPAIVEARCYAYQKSGEKLVPVLKRYRLQELDERKVET
jgi:hypothetical protein